MSTLAPSSPPRGQAAPLSVRRPSSSSREPSQGTGRGPHCSLEAHWQRLPTLPPTLQCGSRCARPASCAPFHWGAHGLLTVSGGLQAGVAKATARLAPASKGTSPDSMHASLTRAVVAKVKAIRGTAAALPAAPLQEEHLIQLWAEVERQVHVVPKQLELHPVPSRGDASR